MKKRLTLITSTIMAFALVMAVGFKPSAAKPASAAETVTTEKFDMSSVTVNTTASYGNSISKRTVSVADADYSPANGPALYGYRLQTVNEYSRPVKSKNTSNNATYSSDGTAITIDTYSVPHNHAITASISQTINTDEDVDFYMAPFVNGSKYANVTASSKFYMILADTDVEVKYNGVTTSGNYLSLVFNRYTVNWSREYDAGDAGYPVEYSEKGRQSGDAQSGQVGSQNAWLKAFYGVPFKDGTYEKTIGLVKTNYHFYNDGNDDYVVITCSGVYKEDISQAISDRSFVYTAKLSDFGLSASSNMKLYFGYAHENAGWANESEGYGFTGDENCQGTPGSDAEVRLIPMGLELYNYTNGIKDVYAVNGGIKVTAGETYDLSDNVTYTKFVATQSAPTITYSSDNVDFAVDGSTLTVAQSANGIATITATADGKSCTFKAYTYNDDDYAVKATWNGSVGTMGANGGKGSLAFYADSDDDKGLYGYRLEGTANYYGFDSAITYAYDVDYAKGESIIIDTVQDQNTGNGTAGNVYKGLRITLRGTDRWKGDGVAISPNVSLAIMPQWTNSYKNDNILRYELRGYGEGATAQVSTRTNASISAALSSAAYYLKVEITSDTTNNTTTFRLVALDKDTFAEVGDELELTIGIGHTGAGRYNYGKNVKLSVSQFTNRKAMAIDDSSLQDIDKTIAVDLGVYNFRNGDVKTLSATDVSGDAGDEFDLSEKVSYTLFDGQTAPSITYSSANTAIASLSGSTLTIGSGNTDTSTTVTVTAGNVSATLSATRAHTWNGGVVKTAATCSEMGVTTYTCTGCGATKDEMDIAIDANAHSWNGGVVKTAATCSAMGVTTYTCVYCSETKDETDIAIDENAHTWDSGEVTTAPTCSAKGVKTYTCTGCGAKNEEEIAIDENAHTWDSGEITTAATCSAKGVKTYTCTGCGAENEEEIAIDENAHDYVFNGFEWDGYTAKAIYVCSHDAEHTEEYAATITKSITAEPTATASGNRRYTATYLENSEYKDETIDARIIGRYVSIGTEIRLAVSAYVNTSAIESPIMNFTLDDISDDKVGAETLSEGMSEWTYTFGVAPQDIGRDITVTIKYGNGDVAATKTLTIKDYLLTVYNDKNATDEAKELVYRMLAYANAAIVYTAEPEEDIVDLIEGTELAEISEDDYDGYGDVSIVNDNATDGYTFKSVNINYGSVNKIAVKFNAADMSGVKVTVDGENAEISAAEVAGRYVIEISGIYAYEFDRVYEVVLYKGEDAVQTLSVSVGAVVKLAAASSKNDDYIALTKALYNYGKASEAYLESLS